MELKEQEKDLYLPEKVRIKSRRQFTELDHYVEVELLERKSLDHKPGQFVQVSMLGIGEMPISISSPPNGGNTFEMSIRTVGELTNLFNRLGAGDEFYIRGPFGHGFDDDILAEMKGKHVVCVAGGCGYAPSRSLIKKLIADKESYEKVSVLYGCKNSQDRLFPEELEEMYKIGGNVEVLETVDKGDDSWKHNVGLITTLIPMCEMDTENTIVTIVGPPIMYKFVIRELLAKGIKKENIFVSLERRMKCAVGKCGHCQIKGLYACQHGPVFRYSEIENNEEAL